MLFKTSVLGGLAMVLTCCVWVLRVYVHVMCLWMLRACVHKTLCARRLKAHVQVMLYLAVMNLYSHDVMCLDVRGYPN